MRIFSTYGPLDIGEWLIPNLVQTLSANQEMKLTKCEQNWSYLHAYDLARAFKFVINREDLNGIVNVGNPNVISLRTAVNEIARKMNSEHLLCFGAIPYRSDQVMNLMPACETLLSIDWKPIVGFESGISQTISWLMGNKANQLLSETSELLTFNLPARSEIFQ
jgi:nucleoside-diphosphate-sugar epimerase